MALLGHRLLRNATIKRLSVLHQTARGTPLLFLSLPFSSYVPACDSRVAEANGPLLDISLADKCHLAGITYPVVCSSIHSACFHVALVC